jgi:hypothetical protein
MFSRQDTDQIGARGSLALSPARAAFQLFGPPSHFSTPSHNAHRPRCIRLHVCYPHPLHSPPATQIFGSLGALMLTKREKIVLFFIVLLYIASLIVPQQIIKDYEILLIILIVSPLGMLIATDPQRRTGR